MNSTDNMQHRRSPHTFQSAQLHILQWNCRGLRRKKALFLQHLQQTQQQPDIILLQETVGSPDIPGYVKFTQPSISRAKRKPKTNTAPQIEDIPTMTITYVHKQIAAIQIDSTSYNTEKQEHVTIEVQGPNISVSTVIVNAYWTPGSTPTLQWVQALTQAHKGKDIVIAGDFNSHNVSWGYKYTTKSGRLLETTANKNHLTLVNDTTAPTRTGNSVERDTNPDLTWHVGPSVLTWENTQENLGSDHAILSITLTHPTTGKLRKSGRKVHITKWEDFRSHLDTSDKPVTLQDWNSQIQKAYKEHTKHLQTTEDTPQIDRHLLELWDRRHKLVKAWKKHKSNKQLKKRIQEITIQAQDYAQQLATQNWLRLCDSFNGHLHTARVWQILRSLLGQTKPRQSLKRMQLATGKSAEEIATELQQLLYPQDPHQERLPDYPHTSPNEKEEEGINSPFTMTELKNALSSFKRNTTPGKDGISYPLLRNLPNSYLELLLEHINEIWKTGKIPQEWKQAVVIPIPKPGKPLDRAENLRPISLTSCLGKLVERMVLTRLEWHIEHTNSLHYTMTGFRRHVSTQDNMLRLHQEVFEPRSYAQTRTIVGLDIQKAFDNVTHKAILDKLLSTGPGQKMYNYIKDFLTNRTVEIQIDDYRSAPSPLHRGVPQGAILSPTLFNIALKDLPAELLKVPDLQFGFYADDITLWCNRGSPSEQEDTLQKGIDTIHQYVQSIGLQCSPNKTEYTVVLDNPRKTADKTRQLIQLHLNGIPIPRKPHIKILGFTLQQNGKSDIWLQQCIKQVNQITQMLSRVTRRRQGMREHEIRKVIEALVISRVMYAAPYMHLAKTQAANLDTQIRKAIRLALGLPRFAPLTKIQATGFLNTLDDRITVHRSAQQQRLSTSIQGRAILQSLKYDVSTLHPIPATPPPWENIPRISILPIPKNMHPELNQERREHQKS